jgi:hypothetical protein
MRYCPHCGRLNSGFPLICRFCSRTWYIRLCPRGHVNPPGSLHCGECGSVDLSETAGNRPWTIYVIKFFIIVILCIIFISLAGLIVNPARGEGYGIIPAFIISIVLLIGTYLFAFSMAPQPIKKVFQQFNRVFSNAVVHAIMWFILKVKELIELLIKW